MQNIQPINDDLAGIGRQLQDFSETLRGLSDHWPCARPVVLWWDAHRKVLAADGALGTYRAIYGNDLVRGLRHIWRFTTRKSGAQLHADSCKQLSINAPLPPDAVVISQRSRELKGTRYVLTIVSEHGKCVLKVFAKERKDRFENELNAWRLTQEAGIGHRVPELISSGESPNGFSWLISSLVRNSAVFYPPVISHWLWRRHLLKQILPDLQRFYHNSGVEVLTGCDLLDRLRAHIADHPASVALHNVIDVAEKARRDATDDRVPYAVVHGDLRPHNVHRHAGKWWLIDWSMSRRAPLGVDIWPHPSSALESQAFGTWLRGHTSINTLPRSLRASLEMYAVWQRSWMGIESDSAALRFQVLATLLDRLCRTRSGRTPLSMATFRALEIQNC